MGLKDIKPDFSTIEINGKTIELKLRQAGFAYLQEKYGKEKEARRILFEVDPEGEWTTKAWDCLIDYAYACTLPGKVSRETIADDCYLARRAIYTEAVLRALGYSLPDKKDGDNPSV